MLVIHPNQFFEVAANFRKANGDPAVIDGVPVWSVDDLNDPVVLTLVATPDGAKAACDTTGVAGNVTVTVEADADLGAGVRHVRGILDVHVVSTDDEAVTVELVPGPVGTH